MSFSATYSPDDNKLRLYASTRLDAETYATAKALGFRWAPKQDLFVAPMWTPAREDFLIDLAGEIDDEDKSLVARAEERAERFDIYSDKRTADAKRARDGVSAIADNIPFGQPILVGHHSEKHARRDAEKIQNGMRKAVKMWQTATYWQQRAAGALQHAAHKERPDVRARRIKTIEADLRKVQKQISENETRLKLWRSVAATTDTDKQHKQALCVANVSGYDSMAFPLADFPRDPPASQYEGAMGIWSALNGGVITAPQAVAIMLPRLEAYPPRAQRWVDHYENRLTYERAMLGESGFVEPPKRVSKALLPLLNYPGEVQYKNAYRSGEVITGTAHPMTRAEFAKIYNDYKGTLISADGTHRIRSAIVGTPGTGRGLRPIYLTDSKTHDPKAEAGRIEKAAAKITEAVTARAEVVARNRAIVKGHGKPAPEPAPKEDTAELDAMRASLKAGVQVVAAPQLFPTPAHIARRMVELAGIEAGHRVLEPSAGTGAILAEINKGAQVVAVEINPTLGGRLDATGRAVVIGDFLACTSETLWGKFDRVLMNPPFKDGADIKHIQHAASMLKPGGVLVAICAGGPRQKAALEPLAAYWEDLPDGTFSEQGTNVRTVLMTIEAPRLAAPSELTAVGEQFVIPGCAKTTKPGSNPHQADLWEAAR